MVKVVFEGGSSKYSISKFVVYTKISMIMLPQKLATKRDEKLITIIIIKNSQIWMHFRETIFEYPSNLITEGMQTVNCTFLR